MNIKQQFKEGLITNNPVLVQLIGMCATMAITTSLFNGIGMGLSVLVILTCCNVVISLIRKVIPNDIRLAIFVLVIAGFVTIVDLLLQAYVPALSASLGVFIPLIVLPEKPRRPVVLRRHLPGPRLHARAHRHVRHP